MNLPIGSEQKWAEIKTAHRYAMSVFTAAGVRDEEQRVQDWDGAKWFWISDAKPTKDEAIHDAWQRLQGAEPKVETAESGYATTSCQNCGLGFYAHFREEVTPDVLRCLPGKDGKHRGKLYHPAIPAPIASVDGDEAWVKAQYPKAWCYLIHAKGWVVLNDSTSFRQNLSLPMRNASEAWADARKRLESAPTAAEPVLGESELDSLGLCTTCHRVDCKCQDAGWLKVRLKQIIDHWKNEKASLVDYSNPDWPAMVAEARWQHRARPCSRSTRR